ncbi:MAG: glycosyltransferase family 2 protein [Campylobacterales bacterium]|nr:glycosyltransferase family 2 protein [Campylobacterales bacterium]
MITLLLATYNGERYLRNQLLSLQQQTFGDWQLLIRDDGSSDATLSIINTFCAHDSRIQLITDAQGRLGAAGSFWQLLLHVKTPYAIFCDQDDVWLERKIELLFNCAQDLPKDAPSIVYCDAHAYSDEEGVITSSSVSHLHASHLREFLFFNSGYQGCSILMNRALIDEAKNYTVPFYMHDDIVSLLAHTFGAVYFLNKPLMLYRQHDRNVTGATARSKLQIAKGFFRSGAAVLSRAHYEEKQAFYERYKNQLSKDQIVLFNAYLSYASAPLIQRLWLIVRHRFSLGGHFWVLLLKTLLRKPIA